MTEVTDGGRRGRPMSGYGATPPPRGRTGAETGRRPRDRRSTSPPYSVAVNAAELRHQMRLRGLTAAEVARRAKARGHRVAEATISHALNGWRIHPAKLRAIAGVLQEVEPLPGLDGLVLADAPPSDAGRRPD